MVLKDVAVSLQSETPTKPNPEWLKYAFSRAQLVYSDVSSHLAQIHVHLMQQVCCGEELPGSLLQ